MRTETGRAVWILGAALACLVAAPTAAQTIRPLVSEYQTEARGRLELVNQTDRPLNVVLEPKGFTVGEDGEVRDQLLGANVHLKLSAMSFRIPARQSRFVFYQATADRPPAWFVVYANFTGYPTAQFGGIRVQLELPHFVYILPKEHWKAADVQVSDVTLRRDLGKLELLVENNGLQFGRLDGLDVQGARRTVHAQGFPLFPGSRRRVEVAWDGEEPDAVSLKSRDFSFEQPLPHKVGDAR